MSTLTDLKWAQVKLQRAISDVRFQEKYFSLAEKARETWWKSLDNKVQIEQDIKRLEGKLIKEIV